MPRSNVKVVLRTRPCAAEQSHLQLDLGAKTATIITSGRTSSGLPSTVDKAGQSQRYQFQFDGILHEASQEAVFEVCAADMVQQALDGYNGCIMCYGQTGAGKTFTMSGNTACYEQRGLIPRMVAALLSSLRSAPGLSSWSLSLSYLEVYNDVLYDLLDINASPAELSLYEDGAGQLQVSGACKVPVTTEAEALALFFEGETNRVIGQHQLNRESSRSHSVFIAYTTCVHEGGDGTATASKLCLVDLAGSERVSKTRSEGLLLREAGAINKSLALLEQVVLAAAAVGRGAWQHVPYRTCKLTHVLKDCLGGNCATLLIANVWGEAAQLEETLSTCRFASRMAALQVDVSRNTVGAAGSRASSARVRALEREVQELREELAMMELMTRLAVTQQQQQQSMANAGQPATDAVAAAGGSTGWGGCEGAPVDKYAPYSWEQRQRLMQQVKTWLLQEQCAGTAAGQEQQQQQQQQQQGWCGSIAPVPLYNLRQLRELLYAYKAVVQEAWGNRPDSGSSSAAGMAAAAGAWGAGSGSADEHEAWLRQQQQEQQPQQQNDIVCVGDGSDESCDSAAALCAAPDDARPSSYGGLSSTGTATAAAGFDDVSVTSSRTPLSSAGYGPSSLAAAAAAAGAGGGGCDRDAALLRYREGPGAEAARVLNENHSRLKVAKRQRQQLAQDLNGLKAQLDDLLQQQGSLKQQRMQRAAAAAEAAAAAGAGGDMQQQQQLSEAVAAAQVMGDEELQLVTVIRDVKAQYREVHAELALVRDQVDYTSALLGTCRAELAAGFEAWYNSTYGGDSTSQPQPQIGCTAGTTGPSSSTYLNSSTGSAGGSSRVGSSTSGWTPQVSAAAVGSGAVMGAPHGRLRVQSTPGTLPGTTSSSSSTGTSPGRHSLQQQMNHQQWQQRRHSTPPLSSLVSGLSSGGGCASGSSGGGSNAGSPSAPGRSLSGPGAWGGSTAAAAAAAGSLAAGGDAAGWAGGAAVDGAAAFYGAQQAASQLGRGAKGGGSFKQQRGQRGTFSLSSRGATAETLLC